MEFDVQLDHRGDVVPALVARESLPSCLPKTNQKKVKGPSLPREVFRAKLPRNTSSTGVELAPIVDSDLLSVACVRSHTLGKLFRVKANNGLGSRA